MLAGVLGEFPECRRIKQRGHLVCDHCAHDLGGIDSANCPECGAAIDAAKLCSFWSRYIRANWPVLVGYPRESPPRWQTKRRSRRVLCLLSAWVAIFVALGVVWRYEPVPAWIVALLFSTTLQGPMRLAAMVDSRGICKRLLRESGLVCTSCGGRATESGDLASCSRCNTQFVTAELRKVWDNWRPACWDLEMESVSASVKRVD